MQVAVERVESHRVHLVVRVEGQGRVVWVAERYSDRLRNLNLSILGNRIERSWDVRQRRKAIRVAEADGLWP